MVPVLKTFINGKLSETYKIIFQIKTIKIQIKLLCVFKIIHEVNEDNSPKINSIIQHHNYF